MLLILKRVQEWSVILISGKVDFRKKKINSN